MRRIVTALLLACLVTAGSAPAVGVAAAATAEAPASSAAPTTTANNSTTLTILSYNDVQTAAARDGNLPRLATLIERRRAAHDNPVLVVGAGDQISPHALSPVSQWRAPVDVLNAVGADVDTVGNHDLDYGTDGFENASDASAFPWVATNLVNETTGEPIDGAERYAVLERDGVRVGVLGVTHQGTDDAVAADLAAQNITVKPTVPTVRTWAEVLRRDENVDVVVVLMHDGVSKAKEVANETDVDAVLTAHDEVAFEPTVVDGAILSEAKARAELLSEINITVSGGDVVAAEGRLLSTDGVPKDPEVSRIINEYRAEVSLDSTVAVTEVPLDSRFATNFHRESRYGNLITDAMRNLTGADVAITNAGGIRSNQVYGPGNITGGDVFSVLPFANTVVVLRLTGAELREALASQVVPLESEGGQIFGAEPSQQVSGVRFEWVGHEGRRLVRDVYVNGEPLDPDANYTVAVNSFMAGGGSGYPLADEPRVNRTGKLLATTVIDYMEAKGVLHPTVEGRMQRVDTDLQDATVRVDGNGKVVLRFDAPADYNGTVPDTFEVSTKGSHTVPAEQVVFDAEDGTLVVRFDDARLASLVRGSERVDLDLYGGYHSSRFDRVFFAFSRLNADLAAVVRDAGESGASGRSSMAGPAPVAAG